MKTNKTKAIEKLEQYNQDDVLKLIDNFNNKEKEIIYNQVNELNFKKIDELYDELSKKEKISPDGIEEITALNKDSLSTEELLHYDKLGESIIMNNQYALVTMSGGQGTRLGYDKPKGTFKINIMPNSKSLFEILADKLKEVNKKYNVIVPWYIMTSRENDKEIQDFFKENSFFNYPKEYITFFKQGNLPLITENKKMVIGDNKKIKEAADGNGGIFNSMYKNKVIKDMEKRRIKWVFISSIDNILLKIADTTLIGLAEDRNVEIATKSILRNSPEEKVGAICKKNGEIRVIEYSEMSDEVKNEKNENGEFKYGESHIMCNLFSINALKKLSNKKLPYHIAHKKATYINSEGALIQPDEPNVYKFETFIFDAWRYFGDIAILRGKREEDFAPIKNASGIDSPQTAIELYNNYYEKINNI